MKELLEVKIHKTFIKEDLKKNIINLAKNENADSILAKLSNKIIYKYLDVVISSKKIHLFTCNLNKKLIGYAILADKPKYLLSEFKILKLDILMDLITNRKFITLVDIIISVLKIDTLNIKKENLDIFENSLNLNLLAISRDFQSKGYGVHFLKEIINTLNYQNFFKSICCETYSKDAENFYVEKFDFCLLGQKLRIRKNLRILTKNLNR